MVFRKAETNQGNVAENSETGLYPKGILIYDKNEPAQGRGRAAISIMMMGHWISVYENE